MPGAFSSKRHFLFDLDGTLVDSSGAHERAYRAALELSYPELARSFEYARFAGQPTRQVFEELGIGDEKELAELTRSKQRGYREALTRGEVEVFAGVGELLGLLREQGRNLFLVTGASRESARLVLAAKGLDGFFKGVVTAEDVARGKPAPEPYLFALTTWGLEAVDCLAIEDGEHGVRSALEAGIETVTLHAEREFSGVRNVGDCETFMALLRE